MRRAIAVYLCLLLAAISLAAPAAAATTFTPDRATAELVRLLVGERAGHGLPALAVDPFLASAARDGAVVCPDGAGTMAGRAKDMALHDYLSHQLRLCPSYDVLHAMYGWGYVGMNGENIASNSGYNFLPYPYDFGCDVAQANCTGPSTRAPTTVAIAAYQWMTSPGHRALVLSTTVDRWGCGSWEGPTAADHTYVCLFAYGPGTAVAPTPSPSATPRPTPTVRPTPRATPKAVGRPARTSVIQRIVPSGLTRAAQLR